MPAQKRSISAPEELFADADRRRAELRYSTFSDYIQALMQADVRQGGAHLREAAAAPAAPPAEPAGRVQTAVSYKKKSRRSPKTIASEGIAALENDLKRRSSAGPK